MFVHGNNLEQKEKHRTKYRDEESRKLLKEIREKYKGDKQKMNQESMEK